jgi:hypothetical protein
MGSQGHLRVEGMGGVCRIHFSFAF